MEETKDTPFARLREFEGTHICAQCGGHLVTIWNDGKGIYQLVCSKAHAHAGVRRIESNTTLLKRGELDTVAGPGTQADLEAVIERTGPPGWLTRFADVATGKALTPSQVQALIAYADSVDLKAMLGHVCLYYGQPYVTIDGYYYLKNRSQAAWAVLTTPMTREERTAYQITEGSHAFIARAITRGGDTLGTGLGIVTPEEMNEKSHRNPENFAAPIVHDKPQRMAEKRAEWQLLKKMISLGADVPPAVTEPRLTAEKQDQAKSDAEILWE